MWVQVDQKMMPITHWTLCWKHRCRISLLNIFFTFALSCCSDCTGKHQMWTSILFIQCSARCQQVWWEWIYFSRSLVLCPGKQNRSEWQGCSKPGRWNCLSVEEFIKIAMASVWSLNLNLANSCESSQDRAWSYLPYRKIVSNCRNSELVPEEFKQIIQTHSGFPHLSASGRHWFQNPLAVEVVTSSLWGHFEEERNNGWSEIIGFGHVSPVLATSILNVFSCLIMGSCNFTHIIHINPYQSYMRFFQQSLMSLDTIFHCTSLWSKLGWFIINLIP